MREEHMWALAPQTKIPPRPQLVRICVLLNTRPDVCSHTCTRMHTHWTCTHTLTCGHELMHTCMHTHTLGMCSHSHKHTCPHMHLSGLNWGPRKLDNLQHGLTADSAVFPYRPWLPPVPAALLLNHSSVPSTLSSTISEKSRYGLGRPGPGTYAGLGSEVPMSGRNCV